MVETVIGVELLKKNLRPGAKVNLKGQKLPVRDRLILGWHEVTEVEWSDSAVHFKIVGYPQLWFHDDDIKELLP